METPEASTQTEAPPTTEETEPPIVKQSTATIGATGDKVRQLQNQLNAISKGYPLIPKVSADGIYGEKTAEAVRVFQKIFNLPQTGVVDYPTWYRISEIYVAVSRIAELN